MGRIENVSIEIIPSTQEEFRALQGRIAGTPQGGAAAMIVALAAFVRDEAGGAAFLAAAADDGRRADSDPARLPDREIGFLRNQLREQPFLPFSYFTGTSPASGYVPPSPPWLLEFSDNQYSGNRETGPFKVFVECSGADSPRPVTAVKSRDGLWRASEWSSLVVGIRQPAQGS
jgi:hypothetical protein